MELSGIDATKIPEHVAIIMDGNGRWAKKKGAARIFGHRNAIKAVREVTECAAEIGVKYLTLYAFSTENWTRPAHEVSGLMQLLVSTISGETKTLLENDIQLDAIGDLTMLPEQCLKELAEAKKATANGKRMKLVLALSYSGRSEILQAVNNIVSAALEGKLENSPITAARFEEYLQTVNIPDPSLLIRTSGEMRISNFLLWQCAYTELYFTEVLWPDFRKKDFLEAVAAFQKRERRFGMTSEQLHQTLYKNSLSQNDHVDNP